MPELFVEFFSEEIPARMQFRAAEDVKTLAAKFLGEAGFQDLKMDSYVTPRRLVLHVQDMPQQQPDRIEEVKGPRVDAPEQALGGFMQANGLKSLDGVEQRVVGKGTHYFIVRNEKGRSAAEVLPEIVEQIIQQFPWPKSMKWGAGDQVWVRPLQQVNAIFDNKVVIGSGEFYGHRFLSPKPFKAKSFTDYQKQLRKNFVILDQNERWAEILQQAEKLAAKQKLTMRQDDALLGEVTGLVEWPVAMLGTFESEFLQVPQECLIATMRTNQKYFPLFDADGKLSNYFVMIANVPGVRGGKEIVDGNERVLRARLADAKFFYDQDSKKSLDYYVEKLRSIQFHEKLGTLYDKAERLADLTKKVLEQILRDNPSKQEFAVKSSATPDNAFRAGLLAKADLATGMVGEFPELQGKMGYYYAKKYKEDDWVASAIRDQYKYSEFGNETIPIGLLSVSLILSDKIDHLNQFFSIGERPTGSKDPYALRRAALGIIRLLVDRDIDLSFDSLARKDVQEFIINRIPYAVPSVPSSNVMAVSSISRDVNQIVKRARILGDLLNSPTGVSLLEAYRRAANILKVEEKKDSAFYESPVDDSRFVDTVEGQLAAALAQTQSQVNTALAADDYVGAAGALAALQPALAAFFDKVMVNADDAAVRTNRLNLLGQIRMVCHQFADFSQIEG